jgi:hypothetical protein
MDLKLLNENVVPTFRDDSSEVNDLKKSLKIGGGRINFETSMLKGVSRAHCNTTSPNS